MSHMSRIKEISYTNRILFLIIPMVLAIGILIAIGSSVLKPSSILPLSKEIMLFISLFVPGYVAQSVLTSKIIHLTLSRGEKIASSFGLSLFLISSLSFATSFLGTGLSEVFNGYIIISSVMFAFVVFVNRRWLLNGLSSVVRSSRLPIDKLFLLSLLFLIIPLFHYFGYAKLNWDGFTFYLRDALAINVSNAVSATYPESIYAGNIPLVFNSYLSSVMYSYGISVLDVYHSANNVPLLIEYTNVALSFVILATLFATFLVLRSLAGKVFKDRYAAAAVVVIFLMTPLVNQFLYTWSLYADLFFAFETLMVFLFAYRFLEQKDSNSKYFSLVMIGIGLSLAIVTKTYGYILLLVIPLLCLRWLKNRALSNQISDKKEANLGTNWNLSKLTIFGLLAIIIAFASLYITRNVALTGSPFGYTIEKLVNYSSNEEWANNIINSSGITLSVENYPLLNQLTALLLSYGLFPLLLIPLLIGTILAIRKETWGLGMFAIYIICYFVIFATILELRVDRHLFSIIPLLPLIYVYGTKAVAEHLKWKKEGVLYMTVMLAVLQLPLFNAIYPDFKITSIFPSMYYWYTNGNVVITLAYSLLTFGVATLLTHSILSINTKRNLQPYVLGTAFSITILVLIALPVTTALAKHNAYADYLDTSYENQHLGYPLALQEFMNIRANNTNDGGRLLYLHGLGTEFLTEGHLSYIKTDDFRMLAGLKDIIEEKDPNKAHELLLSKNIKYIFYPSESNSNHRKLDQLSKVTDNALIFSNPSSITTKKIGLNKWWDLYIV
jgi:hypothetical protein